MKERKPKTSEIQLIKKCKIKTYINGSLLMNENLKTVIEYISNYVDGTIDSYKIVENDGVVNALYSAYRRNDYFYLDELYVLEDYRCHGIAQTIIKLLLVKHKHLKAWVYKDNKDAIRLFKRLGFEIEKDTGLRYLFNCEK